MAVLVHRLVPMAAAHRKSLSPGRISGRLFRPVVRWLTRVRLIPREPELDPDKPVCYILESDALSNVLILQKTCQDLKLPKPGAAMTLPGNVEFRGVMALQHLRGMLFRRPDWRPHLADLKTLLDHARLDPEFDVQMVPVSIFLGRAPDRESGWFKLLFSEDWMIAGRLRRLLSMLVHGRNTLVQISRPVSLKEFLDEDPGPGRRVRKFSRLLRVHFRRTRTGVIGPDLSHRRTVVDLILRSRSVREAIRSESDKKKQSVARVRRRARGYAREIAGDYSHAFIEFAYRVLGWFWNRIYDGVHVHHLENLESIPKGAGIVYVPCHRSHIDYLLISYLVYHNGFAVPHIAAGVNLNLPVAGRIIRKSGAFFLRRSFRSNALYSAVFNRYIDTIFSRGVSMEYFIEGTRSRSGRLLKAKTGMLAMTVQSFLRNRERPVYFLPVYFGYERLVEGDSYLYELSGGKKKKETLAGLLRSFSILREKFGEVHVGFGEPVCLDQHLDRLAPDWRDWHPEDSPRRPEWMSGAMDDLGQSIMQRINAAAHVSPINLLGLALLSSPRHAMAQPELEAQMELMRDLMTEMPYSDALTVTERSTGEILEYGENMGLIERRSDHLGDIILCRESDAWRLSYFRNNALHAIALFSWCACVLRNNTTFFRRDLLRMGRVIYPFLKDELCLRWSPEEFAEATEKALELLLRRGLLIKHADPGTLRRAHGETLQAMQLRLLSQPMFSSLERFYITVALLVKNGSGVLSAGELETLCHLTAKRLSIIYSFESPEFFDKALFKNFIRMLRRARVLSADNDGKLVFDEALEIVIRDAKSILSKEIRHSIWQLSPAPEEVRKEAA